MCFNATQQLNYKQQRYRSFWQSTKAMNSSPFFFDCRFQKNKKISRQGLAKCTYCCILLAITLIIHRRGSFWACGRSERWGARGVSGKIRKNEKKGHSDSEIISLSGSKQHCWFDAYSQLLMFPGLLLVSGDGNTFRDAIEFLCLMATIGYSDFLLIWWCSIMHTDTNVSRIWLQWSLSIGPNVFTLRRRC